MKLVPNQFPVADDPRGRRLAVVGEAQGVDEETTGQPFVGASGRLLRLVLSQNGISPDHCFIGNVCQLRPEKNDITNFAFEGEEIQTGIQTLRRDLAVFRPNTVLSLGRTALRVFNPDICYPVKKTKQNPEGFRVPLADWRGSPFVSSTFGIKVIPTIHPAYVLRTFGDVAYFRPDVARAVRHSADPALKLLGRTGILRPSVEQVLTFLADLRSGKSVSAFDIEGYTDSRGVTMLSIAPSPVSGIVIPFWIDGKNYWSEEEELLVWRALAEWLEDPSCPKICHNAFYETLVLAWRHGIVVAGITGDTMMKHWEIFNELEKSLGVCVSMWIEEPYYKDDRESGGDTKLNYNFKDSACTKGVDEAIEPELARRSGPLEHYKFNVSLIAPFTYLHLRGTRFDANRALQHVAKARAELDSLVERIDLVTKDSLGHTFNPKSTDDKAWYLYTFHSWKPYERYGETTKEEILHRYYKKTADPTLKLIIQAVSLRTRLSDIKKLKPNSDGRVRTSYDLLADTARSKSRTSSIVEDVGTDRKGKTKHVKFGTNLQNVTKPIRDVFIPDGPDFDFWQADLEGADAWTVAADLAARGDDRMLKDLIAKVKPSKLLLAMLDAIEAGRDPSVIARMSSDEAKRVCDAILVPKGTLEDGRPADWKYTCMKRVQHGTNYLAKSETISATIFKDSDGVIDVSPSIIDKYQQLYLLRYSIDLRKRDICERLMRDGTLRTAAGVWRRFYDIRNPRDIDEEVIRAAMASEPQTNTTYVTNVALRNMWYDPENRRKNSALFVEPLLQIHDALAGQFPKRLREWAKVKLKQWFTVPLKINGININIPVDIKVGTSWGNCEEPI